jgi:hypothetical protein
MLRSIIARRDDRGAMAPMIGLLLGTGVLTGMLAISVDVGNVLWERSQLQNSADASALGLAAICAGDVDACDPVTAGPELDPFIDDNNADGTGQFDASRTGTGGSGMCAGNAAGFGITAMPGCSSPVSYDTLADCPPAADWIGSEIPFVEAYTRTDSGGGDTIMPKFFSDTLLSNTDVSVAACARAAWGTPASYTATVPITISLCEWDWFLASGGGYYDPPIGPNPGYGGANQPPWPGAGTEVVVPLHKPNSDETDLDACADNGKDMPGGFGWLDTAGDCSTEVVNGEWVNTDTGNDVPSDCKTQLDGLLGTVVALPIFDCMTVTNDTPSGEPDPAECQAILDNGGGAKTWYHIDGWAAFYVSGWRFSGESQASLATGAVPCSGSDRCLSGWFTTTVLEDNGGTITPPGEGYGAVVVRLAG